MLCFLSLPSNISGNDSVNLLVISPTAFGIFIWFSLCFSFQVIQKLILVWFTLSGVVYKSWYLNALELSFILNLSILAAATYHVKVSGGSHASCCWIYLSWYSFLSFLGIVIYHIYMRIKSKVQYIKCGHQLQRKNQQCQGNHNSGNLEHPYCVTPNNNVTCTEVDLCELRSPLDLLAK